MAIETSEQQNVSNSDNNNAWKLLSPVGHFWLALIVVVIGLAIREYPDYTFVSIWVVQGVVFFPLAAYLGTYLFYYLLKRKVSAKPASKIKRFFIYFSHYYLISILSSFFYLNVMLSFNEFSWIDIVAAILFNIYLSLSENATAEFIVYATLFLASYHLHWFQKSDLTAIFKVKLQHFMPIAASAVFVTLLTMSDVVGLRDFGITPLVDKIEVQLRRTGNYISADKKLKNNRIVELIKQYEERFDLAVTGEPSRDLLKELESEPTKLTFTVGNVKADFQKISSACEHVSKLARDDKPMLEAMERSKTDLLKMEIKVLDNYTIASEQRCDVIGENFHVLITSENSASPSTISFTNAGQLDLNVSRIQSSLQVSGLIFKADNLPHKIINLRKGISFKDNVITVSGKEAKNKFAVISESPENTEIENNHFNDASLLVTHNFQTSKSDLVVMNNHFSGWAGIEVSGLDTAPKIGTNFFKNSKSHLIDASGNAKPKITGKLFVSNATQRALLYAKDNAVVSFMNGSIAGPKASGCVFLSGPAKLEMDNVNVGPCGNGYYPIYLNSDKATAQIKNSRFNRSAGNMRAQFNKPLEDAVLLLENNTLVD